MSFQDPCSLRQRECHTSSKRAPCWPHVGPLHGTLPQQNVPSVSATQFQEVTAPLPPLHERCPAGKPSLGVGGEERQDFTTSQASSRNVTITKFLSYFLIGANTGTRGRSPSKTKRLQAATKVLPWNAAPSPSSAGMASSGENQKAGGSRGTSLPGTLLMRPQPVPDLGCFPRRGTST